MKNWNRRVADVKKKRDLEDEIGTLCKSLLNQISGEGPVILRIENALADASILPPAIHDSGVLPRWIAQQILWRIDEIDELKNPK